MNVLSLFDGMSCGQLALERAGIPIDNYFAAEIDKYAIKVTQANFPETVQLGDVTAIDPDSLPDIDILIGGSPCQGFSFAGKQLNFDDPRSKLFWEYVRLLKALKPKYFLLENVRMKKESMDVITEALGVDPVAINSNLVSAQNRYRLYWTNIPFDVPTEDKGIVLRDILEPEVEEKYYAGKKLRESYMGGNQLNPKYKSQCNTIYPTDGKFATLCAGTHGYSFGYVPAPSPDGLILVGDAGISDKYSYVNRVYHPDGKGPSLVSSDGGHLQPKILQKGRGFNKGGLKAQDGKTPTISTSSWQHNNHLTYDEGMTWRKLTPLECERLQTVPEGYTDHVSNTQRYKMLGNGWTVDVVSHIMKGLTQ
jgi:DNA (cytosine-5)-methyltransferase 3A